MAEANQTGAVTDTLLALTVAPVWNTIRGIRANVAELLTGYPAEFCSAASMVASELLENAFKYGEPVPGAPLISFSLSVADGVLRIETVNGATDAENMEQLQLNLERLASADDKSALYLARLREMASFPIGTSRLGLYRIVAEGEFELGCCHENGVVRVVATRKLPC